MPAQPQLRSQFTCSKPLIERSRELSRLLLNTGGEDTQLITSCVAARSSSNFLFFVFVSFF